MKNEYWIFCKSKKHLELIIDIYDDEYMELSREVRFNELKSLLLNDIMDISIVRIQWEGNGYLLELKKSWTDMERVDKVHRLLENAYAWLIPWHERNKALEDGSLVLDESRENSRLPHYKLVKKQK